MNSLFDNKGPLSGTLVVDMTQVLSGPFSTMCLRELGATVIKVESPDGDSTRRHNEFVGKRSSYFNLWNRGKHSLVLNLKLQEEREVLDKILEKADVLVANFRPGALDRLGYSWENLRRRFPRLIYASISGFGFTGPYKNWAAYDFIVQGMSGLMEATGYPDSKPVRSGASVGDVIPGLYLALSVCAALHGRTRTGKGDFIDIAMFDCMVSAMDSNVQWLARQRLQDRTGHRIQGTAPFQSFKSKDGNVVIAAFTQPKFEILCDALKLPHLLTDERFKTEKLRLRNWKKMQHFIEEKTQQKDSYEWAHFLQNRGIAAGPVNTADKVYEDPQLLARNMLVPTDDPTTNNMSLHGTALKFDSLHDPPTRPAAPHLGNLSKTDALDMISKL